MKIFVPIAILAILLVSACEGSHQENTVPEDPFINSTLVTIDAVIKTQKMGRAFEYRASSSSSEMKGLTKSSDSKSQSEILVGNSVSTGNIEYCSMRFLTAEGEQFFTSMYSLNWRHYNGGWHVGPHPLYGVCMAIDVTKPPVGKISADRTQWRIGGSVGRFDVTDQSQ